METNTSVVHGLPAGPPVAIVPLTHDQRVDSDIIMGDSASSVNIIVDDGASSATDSWNMPEMSSASAELISL